MDNPSCPKCQQKYTKKRQKPRVLQKCGHTFCEQCLTKNKIFVCPLDKLKYKTQQLSKFPINVFIMNMLQKKVKYCQSHQKVLEFFCLQEGEVICSNCGLFGEHQAHSIIPIQQVHDKNQETQ